MASIPSPLYAGDAAAGLKDGTSFANRFAIDPNIADDVWNYLNTTLDTLDTPVEVRLCTNSATVTTGATIDNNKNGTATKTITVRGYDGTDGTTKRRCVLDAGGGAYPVFTLTNADWWIYDNLTAQNTDKAAGNDGWESPSESRYVRWLNCKAIDTYIGFHAVGTGCNLYRCLAKDTGNYGFSLSVTASACECISDGAGLRGFITGIFTNCVAANSTVDGFFGPALATGCVSYGNGADGFQSTAAYGGLLVRCISANNLYGFDPSASWFELVDCAGYNNTSGAFNGTNYHAVSHKTLTADPFIDAANGDFALNNTAGGGRLCRSLGISSADGLFTSYEDVGAARHEDVHPVMSSSPVQLSRESVIAY